MAVSARLETLQNKHSNLETEIQRELRHPAPDDARLADLKKQKLHIKDTLSQLSRD